MGILSKILKPEAKRGAIDDSMLPVELDDGDRDTLRAAAPFTMTSPARLAALVKAVRHIVHGGIEGDIVECGVWRGGSMIAVAKTLLRFNHTRTLHLFDTFEGMPPPTTSDVQMDGRSAAELLESSGKDKDVWAIAGLEEVKRSVLATGYASHLVRFVQGKVEDTIPKHAPDRIALLRLDTDWYESTKHELEHLWPRLAVGGVLIIDDYGHWQGARKAVDEYFSNVPGPLLNVIDYTGRIGVKVTRSS